LASSAETRVQLCGKLVIRLAGERIESALPGRQGRLLFVFLAANRVRAATRDELVETLWQDASPPAADSALSALLSKLRRLLPQGSLEGRSAVRLILPDDAWVDLEAAAAAIHEAESAVAQGDWLSAWAPARIAHGIGGRILLAGEDAPWIVERRRWLEDVRLRAHECIAVTGLGLGGPELAAAERSGRALVDSAPYREVGYRLLMEALAARGEAAEALRVYERLRALLREELGVAPSAESQALHRRLLGADNRPGG
jgi:DNA-binding SARP family transcriptional activator